MNLFCIIPQPTFCYYWESRYWLLELLENGWGLLFVSIFMLYTVLILRALLKYMRG